MQVCNLRSQCFPRGLRVKREHATVTISIQFCTHVAVKLQSCDCKALSGMDVGSDALKIAEKLRNLGLWE